MDWELKDNAKPYDYENGEFWYDIAYGGYLNIKDILSNKDQIEYLQEAIDLVYSFEKFLKNLNDEQKDTEE